MLRGSLAHGHGQTLGPICNRSTIRALNALWSRPVFPCLGRCGEVWIKFLRHTAQEEVQEGNRISLCAVQAGKLNKMAVVIDETCSIERVRTHDGSL